MVNIIVVLDPSATLDYVAAWSGVAEIYRWPKTIWPSLTLDRSYDFCIENSAEPSSQMRLDSVVSHVPIMTRGFLARPLERLSMQTYMHAQT